MNEKKENHKKRLGWYHIIFGVFNLIMVIVSYFASGLPIHFFTNKLSIILHIFLSLFIFPAIIGGIGLIRQKSWARRVSILFGHLFLIYIPIGTLLGAYTIWVFTDKDT